MATYTGDMTDQLGIDGTNNSSHIAAGDLTDQLGIDGTVGELLPIIRLADTLGFDDTLKLYLYEYLSDQLGLNDSLSAVNGIVASVIDKLGISDTPATSLKVFAPLTDKLGTSDTVLSNAILPSTLTDVIGIGIEVDFGDGVYTGWVVNTKSLGSSQYAGYNLNSLCKFKGQYIGARQDGLYLLEGADDAGTQIDAYIKTGQMDFLRIEQKRVPKIYLGLKSDGNMILKTVTDENVERLYELTSYDNHLSDKRVQLHRGVKSRYWQFEIANKAGADFEIDRVDFLPVILTRRTGGKK